VFVLIPSISWAQTDSGQASEQIFKAQVTEILDQQTFTRDDGSVSERQKIKLVGLEGEWKNKTIIFDGT